MQQHRNDDDYDDRRIRTSGSGNIACETKLYVNNERTAIMNVMEHGNNYRCCSLLKINVVNCVISLNSRILVIITGLIDIANRSRLDLAKDTI